MNINKNYIVFEIVKETQPLQSWLNDPNCIIKGYGKKVSEFLAIKNDSGISNCEQIKKLYVTDEEKKKNPNCETLKTGTMLFIPNSEINKELQAILGKDLFLEQEDFFAFQNEEYKKLLRDKTFIQSSKYRLVTNSGKTSIDHIELSCKVWIYSRALDKILDVTAYVQSLSTSVSLQGGNFSVMLSLKQDEIIKYFTNTAIIEYFSTTDNSFGDFFSKVFQQNDVIFIRFEKLEIEKDRREELDKFEIPFNELSGKIYDMIGLVDNTSIPLLYEYNNMNFTLSGRDLTKLIIEDGSYFYPYALIQGGKGFYINASKDTKALKRLFVDAKYNILFAYSFRTIRNTLAFIFNQLSNIGIVPEGNQLFSSFKKPAERFENGKYVPAEGVWKIIHTLVDEKLNKRRVVNGDITNPSGTLQSQIQKVCQKPFVEFWGDTYGDKYVFTARQPPLNRQAVIEALESESLITVEDAKLVNLNWETTYYSIYRLTAQQAFFGYSNYIAMAHIPVIYFPEYINNFGMQKLETPLNYLPAAAFDGDSESVDANTFRNNIAQDFAYIIEINSYLPFTRKGTIVIQGGDRRIKRGMWIKLAPTNELCFVDAVSHTLNAQDRNLDRQTVLQVSRCMLVDYIKKKPVTLNQGETHRWLKRGEIPSKSFEVSYFDIVKTKVIINALTSNNKTKISTATPFLINKDVFDFFLKRRQLL
jgi:hypothetical protein